jgi:hypothetical protein
VNATTELREQILAALDPLFGAEGFRRRKRDLAYCRKVSGSLTQSVHLNCALYEHSGAVSILPNLGARHNAIEHALVEARVVSGKSKDRATVARALAPNSYEATTAAGPQPAVEAIWADWQSVGRQHLQELSSLEHVLTFLASTERRDWGLTIPGMRARILLLVLDELGRRSEALARLPSLEQELAGRDQVRPNFAAFATWFRSREPSLGEKSSAAG